MNKTMNFVIKTMNGMAYGLFSTLIIGTIIGTIAGFFDEGNFFYLLFNSLSTVLRKLTGVGIGIGIAWSLKLDGLKLICATISGGIASYFSSFKLWEIFKVVDYNYFEANTKFQIGDPLSIYLVVIFTVLLITAVLKKKTPVDIILIPLFAVVASLILSMIICGPVSALTTLIGRFVNSATVLQPFLMGIVISVVMGMALTAPISSAAIAVAIGLEGLAGGAAVVGCCVQMLGFAVMSRKDNSIGMVISTAIGTSMLQFKNILKKPIIWLPTIIVSAILGPIGTCLFKIKCNSAGAGMGTSGLVGYFGTIDAMGGIANSWVVILVLLFILPVVLVYILDLVFRKFNLIKQDDLRV